MLFCGSEAQTSKRPSHEELQQVSRPAGLELHWTQRDNDQSVNISIYPTRYGEEEEGEGEGGEGELPESVLFPGLLPQWTYPRRL